MTTDRLCPGSESPRCNGGPAKRCAEAQSGTDVGKYPCADAWRPFANIAHGCNSVRATKLALKMADYCITEAGFGSDLGAEKFLDIKCRYAGLAPSAIVIVATLRALKYNGGVPKTEVAAENVDALKKGLVNLEAHVENMRKYGVPVVVAINRFLTDTDQEIKVLAECCQRLGVEYSLSEVFAKGGDGAIDLAQKVVKACAQPSEFRLLYDEKAPIKEKIKTIVTEIYGGEDVAYAPKAEKAIRDIEALGKAVLPICVAKTQYSLSDDPAKLGRPTGFTVNVRDIKLSAGAGFIVVMSGDIMTMPGLPKSPCGLPDRRRQPRSYQRLILTRKKFIYAINHHKQRGGDRKICPGTGW